MKKKSVFLFVACLFGLILIIIGFFVFSGDKNVSKDLYNGKPVIYVHSVYVADTSTPEKAIGASNYAFVAVVNSIKGVDYRNPVEIKEGFGKSRIDYDPYTKYSITILQNIKGELVTNKEIEILQFGGLNKDGESYTISDDAKMLEVGKKYILMPSVIAETGEIEVSNPNNIVLLEEEKSASKNIAFNENNLINKYVSAYKNQEIPKREDGSLLIQNYKSKYDLSYSN